MLYREKKNRKTAVSEVAPLAQSPGISICTVLGEVGLVFTGIWVKTPQIQFTHTKKTKRREHNRRGMEGKKMKVL